MSDFLRGDAKGGGKLRAVSLERPRAPRHSRRQRERALAELLRDFRLGLTSLRGLTQRLHTVKPDYKAQRGPVAPPPPAITKIIERERKVVERMLMHLPAKERELLMREHTTHMQTVIKEQTPQTYAAILRGAQIVKPAQVMRPDQPYVKELMATARAIRSGRVPFLPKEVRTKARQLLSVLFGKQRATELLNSKDVVTRRLITQYRLIPQAVQAAVSVKPVRQMTRVERELQTTLRRVLQDRHTTTASGTPISATQMAMLAPALPALHTGGIAGGGGEYRMQTDRESKDVITPSMADSLMTSLQSGSAPSESEGRELVREKMHKSNAVKTPDGHMPSPATSVRPSPNESMTSPITNYDAPKPTTIERSSGPGAQSPQSLKVKDVEGLADWITRTERRLDEFNG